MFFKFVKGSAFSHFLSKFLAHDDDSDEIARPLRNSNVAIPAAPCELGKGLSDPLSHLLCLFWTLDIYTLTALIMDLT